MKKPLLVLVFALFATICASASTQTSAADANTELPANAGPLTTYERFLPLAVAGDPAIQHFLGYMFFYGEGVELDYEAAHYWFHQAAEEGDSRAQRNLGVFHARAIPRIPEKFYDVSEANLWFSLAAANPENPKISPLATQAYDKFLASRAEKSKLAAGGKRQSGESIYHGFCAGCHGFNGRAAYPDAPSFAHGDRLERSDSALVASILHGKGKMPAQNKILSPKAAEKTVSYIRKAFGKGAVPAVPVSGQTALAGADQLAVGEQVYLNFCGGCHGFNGIAWYVNSPSFALRERMDKTDAELKHSIKNGRGVMPSWEYMLKPDHIDALVQYIRTLAQKYDAGIIEELRRPEQFLRFRPKIEHGPDWTGDDLR